MSDFDDVNMGEFYDELAVQLNPFHEGNGARFPKLTGGENVDSVSRRIRHVFSHRISTDVDQDIVITGIPGCCNSVNTMRVRRAASGVSVREMLQFGNNGMPATYSLLYDGSHHPDTNRNYFSETSGNDYSKYRVVSHGFQIRHLMGHSNARGYFEAIQLTPAKSSEVLFYNLIPVSNGHNPAEAISANLEKNGLTFKDEYVFRELSSWEDDAKDWSDNPSYITGTIEELSDMIWRSEPIDHDRCFKEIKDHVYPGQATELENNAVPKSLSREPACKEFYEMVACHDHLWWCVRIRDAKVDDEFLIESIINLELIPKSNSKFAPFVSKNNNVTVHASALENALQDTRRRRRHNYSGNSAEYVQDVNRTIFDMLDDSNYYDSDEVDDVDDGDDGDGDVDDDDDDVYDVYDDYDDLPDLIDEDDDDNDYDDMNVEERRGAKRSQYSGDDSPEYKRARDALLARRDMFNRTNIGRHMMSLDRLRNESFGGKLKNRAKNMLDSIFHGRRVRMTPEQRELAKMMRERDNWDTLYAGLLRKLTDDAELNEIGTPQEIQNTVENYTELHAGSLLDDIIGGDFSVANKKIGHTLKNIYDDVADLSILDRPSEIIKSMIVRDVLKGKNQEADAGLPELIDDDAEVAI